MRQVIRKFAIKARKVEPLWRYGFNFFPSVNYKIGSSKIFGRHTLDVIKKLNRDGVAVTTVDELLDTKDYFSALETAVGKLLKEQSAEIEQMKMNANDEQSIGSKTFNIELLGSQVNFEPESVFAHFALQDTVLNIANAYFGMYAKLRYYNVWQTFATQSKARESQLWHFDREDNYILKLFVYLNDVDEGAGPFTYAPETHRKGKLWSAEPEHFIEGGVQRSTDEQMAAVVSKEKWLKGIGRKGTIIFADTRGYHKGGEARTKDRLMYTCMFTSQASESQSLLQFTNDTFPEDFTKQQLIAVKPF